MELLQRIEVDGRLFYWGAAAVALLATLLAASSSRLLLDFFRSWRELRLIPGISPCYPLLGNVPLFERDGAALMLSICFAYTRYQLKGSDRQQGEKASGQPPNTLEA
uniref:Uncharacterized protein n=1 Tax=Sphaerodactylus townsendi TaxID=933632 RepID=A0ACB8E7G4_9SAUR